MVILVRKISLSLKLLLSFLFGVLLLAEAFDGISDVSDWAVPFFFILMFNDFVVHTRMMNGKNPVNWTLSNRVRPNGEKLPLKKVLMNVFIVSILTGSFILEFSGVQPAIRDQVYKFGFVLWSSFFLGSNIYNLKDGIKISRLVVTNIAFFIFVGSLTLI